jgi:protein-disulfide isomerase
MTSLRRIALAPVIALAMGLAACGDDAGSEATASSEPIAPIAAPAGTGWVETAAETPEGGILLGNPDAPVKLIEYVSLTCPACAAFAAEAADELKQEYVSTGVVSYELRHQVHNGVDLALVRLTRCGTDPAAVMPLAEQVWANLQQIMGPVQQNPQLMESAMSRPEEQRFVALAQNLGLVDFFAARGIASDQQVQCLSDFQSLQAIADRSDRQSEELDVTGTPTFFINGRNLGSLDWATLEANLQNAGAR